MPTTHHPGATYPVHSIPLSRPFVWLIEGWGDLLHHRGASLAYGLLVSALGALILAYDRHPFFIAAMTAGFLLVGPIFTAGLCELSRCQDRGEKADFESSLLPLRRNRSSLMGFAKRLAMISVIWFALSGAILFGLVGSVAPSVESTLWGGVMQQLTSSQLSAYLIVGLVLAGMVFALSVVTVPMIVDRHVDAITAMRTSLRVTTQALPAMLVWAVLIAALVLFGFATGLLAMVFIFPLLGHATWRAYSELVDQ
jgi:uncharacterized membrane protein